MAARGDARPGELVEWRAWVHDPFGPTLGEKNRGLVVGEKRAGFHNGSRQVVDILCFDGSIAAINTHKLKVISRPYVKYKGIV